jgi:hypothetical protein
MKFGMQSTRDLYKKKLILCVGDEIWNWIFLQVIQLIRHFCIASTPESIRI